MASIEQIDVLVCGAGPAGLLIALGLSQQGIGTLIIEKRDRLVQASYGRASLLYPRSMELLEQVDVAEPITQEGYVSSVVLNWRDGQRVTSRGLYHNNPSLYPGTVGIRQTNSEDIIHAKYVSQTGKRALYGWALADFIVDSFPKDGYNVTSTLENVNSGEKKTVRSKYIIGADGGNSTVRRIAGIPMEGLETEYKWIRMDGKYKTDMPDSNIGTSTLETKTHGNVLWQKLNRDMHRIGFVVTPALQEKFRDGATEELVVSEAIAAVKPFKLEVERVDWFTLYSIKQKVAATLQQKQFILLAGDAAHTHSSALAQGMNTAIHDATNLVWKLSGVLKGWYPPQVLETYNTERWTAAKQLIKIDESVAAVISGNIPPQYGAADADVDVVLQRIWADNVHFSMGHGVKYAESILNKPVQAGQVHPGTRAPDALIRRPGPRLPVRLQEIMRASGLGKWTVVVFAGYPAVSKAKVNALRDALGAEGGFVEKRGKILNLATLSASPAANAWAAFGGPALGRLLFDPEGEAHHAYSFSLEEGGVAVMRPDSVFGFGTTLDGAKELESYFDAFCI